DIFSRRTPRCPGPEIETTLLAAGASDLPGSGLAGAAAGAVRGAAARTSDLVMRPEGPVPWMRARSTPRSAAIFLATEVARALSSLGAAASVAASTTAAARPGPSAAADAGAGAGPASAAGFSFGGAAVG